MKTKKTKKANKKQYVICRTYSAGVFAGYLKSQKGQEVVLTDARRLWYWDGASSLSELAVRGVSRPENCKFPCAVPSVILTQVIEIIPCTQKAQRSIARVKEWTQHAIARVKEWMQHG